MESNFNEFVYYSMKLTQKTPSLTDDGCAIIDVELYYISGLIEIPSLGRREPNKVLFKVDLRNAFKLSGNAVGYEEIRANNIFN
ncbi:hypothetical protein K502DRAFT_351733 [Neoconidiobolus thromboides FSU 785]|nr:hypothetical protein K502DRAFT_351733 [Neoconidiobolus thromboides FSU 785]